jgi:hypothetical protein
MTPSDSTNTPITTFSCLPRALLAASCSHFTLYLRVRYHSFNVLSALHCFGQHNKRVPRLPRFEMAKGKANGHGNRRKDALEMPRPPSNKRKPKV